MGGGGVERVLLSGSDSEAGEEGGCGFEVSLGRGITGGFCFEILLLIEDVELEIDASAIFRSSSLNPMTEATSMDEDFVLGSMSLCSLHKHR